MSITIKHAGLVQSLAASLPYLRAALAPGTARWLVLALAAWAGGAAAQPDLWSVVREPKRRAGVCKCVK